MRINRHAFISPNYDDRPDGVRPGAIIFHSCEGRPFGRERTSSLPWLCNPQPKTPKRRVSSHLYIGRGGEVWQLVDLDKRAWHAGKTNLLGRNDWADFSIGVEIEHAQGAPAYPALQLAAIVEVGAWLVAEFHIRREWLVTHRAVAWPRRRKIDPTDMSDALFAQLADRMLTARWHLEFA